ncbi:hypothetical protein J1C56_01900 [Aminobacter anthyllidis]|uniref:Uncharacterized protein n=1 Tax=Aminobacter anthyllidis TaxID=1035067 RepID=A0A9X1D1V4_9HYPH|nr:hypothetical protein [Aminobacter anthyllidis]MBT1154337.1 hypothetical protein [Aminobacter anthyllidis]
MGKRSDFPRRPMDGYQTIDPRAVAALVPYLAGVETFAEPCAGEGHLIRQLEGAGLRCGYSGDLSTGQDALKIKFFDGYDAIITNPPWTREILHPMIRHFQRMAPTWLLFDADWAHTGQSAPFMAQCSHIVSVGRLRWIEGTKHTGKDNVAWHRFHAQHHEGPRFVGRPMKEAA